jgi:hypothetical protein
LGHEQTPKLSVLRNSSRSGSVSQTMPRVERIQNKPAVNRLPSPSPSVWQPDVHLGPGADWEFLGDRK